MSVIHSSCPFSSAGMLVEGLAEYRGRPPYLPAWKTSPEAMRGQR